MGIEEEEEEGVPRGKDTEEEEAGPGVEEGGGDLPVTGLCPGTGGIATTGEGRDRGRRERENSCEKVTVWIFGSVFENGNKIHL